MPAPSPQSRPSLAAHAASARALPRALRPLALFMLLLLLAQFLIGMVVNLYVEIPAVHPGTQGASPLSENPVQTVQGLAWALAHGELAMRVHVVLGLLLGVTAVALIAISIAARRRAWIIVSVAGFLTIAGAGINGVAFVNAGGQNLNSMAMSVNFLLAWIAYAIGLYRTR